MATDVNSGTDYENTYFVQTADITLSGEWMPIGKDADHPFKGRYNGGGYTNSGLIITTNGQYAGLFGYVKGGSYQGSEVNTHLGEVHGVVLVNPVITVTATSSEQYAGAVVGYGGDCSRVYDNTVIGGSVTFTGGSNYNTNNSYAGGLTGYYSSSLPKFSGNKVSGTTVSGGGVCGGLVGYHSSYSTQLSGNFADANVSSVEYDNYTDIHTYGYRQGALAGYCNIINSSVSSVNYYHSRNGLTAYGNKTEHHAISPVADNSWVAPLYTVTATDGLTASGTPTVSLNGTDYYAADATVTLSTDADHIISGTPTVTGAASSTMATDRKSMTVTIGTADVTVSATLLTIAGTCSSDGSVTWRMSDANSDGTYETLSINYSGSGTGAMTDYTSSFGTPNTPWKNFLGSITTVNIADGVTHIGNLFLLAAGNLNYGISTISLPASVNSIGEAAFLGNANLARVNIGKSDGVVTLAQGNNEFRYCHSSLAIVVPTPALAVQYATATNWSNYAAKLRVALGSYLFTVTNEGGTAAYAITSEADLRLLSEYVNGGSAVNNMTFRQTANISMSNETFQPIAWTLECQDFRYGTYDGGGYVISGLNAYSQYYSGLFGRIGGGATIKNVNLMNPTVTGGSMHRGAVVGWVDVNSQCNVSNCHYYGSNNYAVVNADGGNNTVTNCGRARKVTAGDGITIAAPAATEGFTYGDDNYYREGVTLTLTSDVATTAGYTATYSANGAAIDGSTYTVNSTDGDVTLSGALASDGQTHSVAYVDADGTLHDGDDAAQAVALDGTETSLAAGTYFAGLENVNFDHKLTLTGDVTLILKDGCTMNVGTSSSRIDGKGFNYNNKAAMTVFGQSLGSGALSVYTTGGQNSAISVNALTVNGGNVIANTDGMGSKGIYANSDFTINGGSVTAYCTGASSNGIFTDSGDIIISGGTVNATAEYYGVNAGGTITLGWTKPTDRIFASSYYGIVAVADGKKLHNGSSYLYGILGDPAAADVNGKTLRPAATATYTTADGNTADASAIVLDPGDNSLPAGNYLATGTLNYTHGITLNGPVTLILADNCHMNVGTSGEGRINGRGIDGPNPGTGGFHDLTITSQSLGSDMGALNIYTTGSNNAGIRSGALTINGGNITADTNGKSAIALNAGGGALTINNGTVTANATGTDAHAIAATGNFNYNGGTVNATAPNSNAICADVGNYTFSWRTAADRITIGATGLYAPAAKTATFTRLFTDGNPGNYYGGTLAATALSGFAAETTLQPCLALAMNASGIMTYAGTYALDFTGTLSDTDGAAVTPYIVSDFDGTAGTLTLSSVSTVPAQTGLLLKGTAGATFYVPLTTTADATTTNYLHGVTDGTTVVTMTDGTNTNFILANGKYGIDWYTLSEAGSIGANKAYLSLPTADLHLSSGAARFTWVYDGETTGLTPLLSPEGDENGVSPRGGLEGVAYYTLDGRKLDGKPSKAGLYINNGKKVIIK